MKLQQGFTHGRPRPMITSAMIDSSPAMTPDDMADPRRATAGLSDSGFSAFNASTRVPKRAGNTSEPSEPHHSALLSSAAQACKPQLSLASRRRSVVIDQT